MAQARAAGSRTTTLVLAQPTVPSIPSSSHLQYLLLDLLQYRSLCLAPLCGFQSSAVRCSATRVPSLGGIDPTSAGVFSGDSFKGDEPRLSAYSVYSRGSRRGHWSRREEQENKETTLGADPDEFHWLPFFVSDTGAQYASDRHLGVYIPLRERTSSALPR